MSDIHHLNAPRSDSSLLEGLIPIVGDLDKLDSLDADPWPDEPFDWSSVDDEDRDFVSEVLALSDACCDTLLDVEFRTIARRILARLARRNPRYLRRSVKADRVAAAVVYLAGRANMHFGRHDRKHVHDLWSWWGLSSCADRARTLRAAAGLEPAVDLSEEISYDVVPLGDPTLLHSKFRELLCLRRDLIKQYEPRPRWTPISGTNLVGCSVAPVKPIVASKGVANGRVIVVLGLGENLDDADLYGLSVPDTRDLVRMLENAVNAPTPRLA